ncbi:MAG: RHS repeat protein, partial [bacterium]|nr:RHS repeat protein [bacterium]
DACDLTDPWKVYDPADPAASDLTAVDHEIGMWVSATAADVLPSDGTLPATTTIELCEGWNLIGFPTAEPRHPYAALASIAGKWQRIFGYDAFDPEDPWEVFSIDVPDWANDLSVMQPGRGYWVLANEAVTLEIRNQGPPPNVAIAAPADLAVVTEPTEIIGTVDSDRLESWTLTSRPIGDGNAVTLATGNAPVAGGTLATFDPTLLLNGLYELELTATDVQGQQVSESIAVSVEGQMKIGHFTLSFVDLAIPVSGLDIEIIRTYDSRDKQPRDFGVGWSLDIRQGSYRNNRLPGDGWQLQTGFVACDTAVESKSHLTVVRLSDREVYRFALRLFSGEPAVGGGGCQADARFDFIDGPLPGTTLEILGNDQVFWENGSDRVINVDTFETYEPEGVRLTTRDGRIFELDLNDGVTLVEDLNGNQLSITPAGITHLSGKGINFERDAEGRITRITDPLDRVNSYAYDVSGDLVSFTNRTGAETRFVYDDDHRLLEIEDPMGGQPIRNEYDAEGRLVRHMDALGKVIEFAHDLDNRRELITNRLGASRVMEYDARGNVVRETDELGNATTRSFDARDNLLSEIDPLGHVTAHTYDAADDLAMSTDPLGNVTSYTYNGRGQVLTVTDPRGGTTTSTYDGRGNLTQTTNALGNVTAYTYDTAGSLLTKTDAASQVTGFEYDNLGHRTREIDALGNATDFTYDATGNRLTKARSRTLNDGSTETLLTSWVYNQLDQVTTTVNADGTNTSTAYNILGKVVSYTDQLGRVKTLTYDLAGRQVNTSYPDGTIESRSFDDEARIVARVDRGGRATAFQYDPAGRLQTTTYPDASSISNSYDAAGQILATVDARGNTTGYSYDAAGRPTGVIDPLGNGPTYTYDPNGNRKTLIDASGRTTTFTYDALDRLVTTTYPDGSTTHVGLDNLGRRISETDQAGTVTELGYDPLGRLISVKDTLEQTTSYTYDEVGNRLTQTDANGRTTSFEYDSAGRQTARVFPGGARESMSYIADGSRSSHTDFNGATRIFQYDANRRLTRRAYPDGSEVTFTYTPAGRRATVTDSRGTTSYTYDSRDRLTEKTDPNGYKLGFTYDLQGNRSSLSATAGTEVYTTTYTYDALNRVSTVTDSQGGVANLGYDPNGNRASLLQANGIATTYSYDDLDRLTALQSRTSADDVLQSYQYTLGPAGNRLRVDEHDGTSRHYQYDALYRLTEDRVTDDTAALVYQSEFTYDPVGNRVTKTLDEGDGPATLASTYDVRDRLLSLDSKTYAWDTNGNLTNKTGNDDASYQWDFENRLTSVTLADRTVVETAYDADGNRVQTSVTPPGGPPTTVDHLVDASGSLSQVVGEISGGQFQTFYVRVVDQLLSLHRPGSTTTRFFHADGLGSVRALTDDSGAVTDVYSYTAFGQLLSHTGTDLNPYAFAGEAFDPNIGFYYNRARWLDPESGRFTSGDPFQGLRSDPFSLHRYLYANGSPQNSVDPSGLVADVMSLPGQAGALLVLAIVVAIVVIGIAELVRIRRNSDSEITAYRAIPLKPGKIRKNNSDGNNGTFRWDYDPPVDGLSVYEEKTGGKKKDLPFVIRYRGPKETGTPGVVVEVGDLPPPVPMIAAYDDPPEGHWLIWYVDVDFADADHGLVQAAKQFLLNGGGG